SRFKHRANGIQKVEKTDSRPPCIRGRAEYSSSERQELPGEQPVGLKNHPTLIPRPIWMQIVSRSSLIFHLAIAAITGVGVGVAASAVSDYGWVMGLAALLAGIWMVLWKPLRRRRAVQREMPEVRAWLERNYPWSSAIDLVRFGADVKILLDDWTIEGVGGVDVTPKMRLAVAGGAALLLHGRPEWELPRRQSVLFYPDRFDEDYLLNDEAAFDGMAHQQGPVILSAAAVEESWAHPTD